MFGRWKKKSADSDASADSTQSDNSGDSAATAQPAPLENWDTQELDGHRIDVFTPLQPKDCSGCVLFLHGHGRVLLNENEVFTGLLAEHNLACVAPDGNRSWWLDRICSDFSTDTSPQDWLIDAVVPFVQSKWQIEPPHIALLGVSMGGQGAQQLSFRDASMFPIVAAISPAIDFHQLYGQGLPLDEMFEDIEDARQTTIVLNLHPLAWPRHQWFCCDPQDNEWFDGCARLGMKLSSSGILHERDFETSAGGHSWEYFNAMAPKAFDHIVAGLASY